MYQKKKKKGKKEIKTTCKLKILPYYRISLRVNWQIVRDILENN